MYFSRKFFTFLLFQDFGLPDETCRLKAIISLECTIEEGSSFYCNPSVVCGMCVDFINFKRSLINSIIITKYYYLFNCQSVCVRLTNLFLAYELV